MQRIRYLGQEEKNRSRKMYETNFPDDSQKFVDYYYKHKIKDNQILVMENKTEWQECSKANDALGQETAQLQVMLHLNPYTFSVYGREAEVNYIVAVATDVSVRRQGKMTEVMELALRDMAEKGQPFTFLIPANPKVYVSKGFTFVETEDYKKICTKLEELQTTEEFLEKEIQAAEVQSQSVKTAEVMEQLALREAVRADIPQIIEFSNRILEEKYNVFPRRTEKFYIRKLEELKSENGGIVLLFVENRLVGMCSYGKEAASVELQEILVEEAYKEHLGDALLTYFKEERLGITTMPYMVRILDLKTLVSLLSSQEPFSLKVQVKDDIIPQNEGCYEIQIYENGGRITAIPKEENISVWDISELTKEIFGHVKLFIREWV